MTTVPSMTNFLHHWEQSILEHAPVDQRSDMSVLLPHVKSIDQLRHALERGANPASRASALLLEECLKVYDPDCGKQAKMLLALGGAALIDVFCKEFGHLPISTISYNNPFMHTAMLAAKVDWASYRATRDRYCRNGSSQSCGALELLAQRHDFELLNKMVKSPHVFTSPNARSQIDALGKELLNLFPASHLSIFEQHKFSMNVANTLTLLMSRHPEPSVFLTTIESHPQFKNTLTINAGVVTSTLPPHARKSSVALDPQKVMGRRHKTVADINMLAQRGFNLNGNSNSGFPLLFDAVRQGKKAVCAALLDHGADPNVRSRCGRNITEMACSNMSTDLLKLLLERGAHPPTAKYLIEIAAKNCDVPTIQLLAGYPKLIAQGKPWHSVRKMGQKSIPTYEALAAAGISPFIKDPVTGLSFEDQVNSTFFGVDHLVLRRSLQEYFLFLKAHEIQQAVGSVATTTRRPKKM